MTGRSRDVRIIRCCLIVITNPNLLLLILSNWQKNNARYLFNMKTSRYLFPNDYMADPSAHVFEDKIYIYPSHDWESGVPENDNGDHFNMRDYHVCSMDDPDAEVVDRGVVLTWDTPWVGRQLGAAAVAHQDGNYFLHFRLKDQNDIFRMGVAISERPEGLFSPEENPMKGSSSIDPCLCQDNGAYYMYCG